MNLHSNVFICTYKCNNEREMFFLLLCTFCFKSLLSLLKVEETPDLHVRNGVRAGS